MRNRLSEEQKPRTLRVEFSLRVENGGTEKEGLAVSSAQIPDFFTFVENATVDQVVNLLMSALPLYCDYRGVEFKRCLLKTEDIQEPLIQDQMIQCDIEVL